MQVIELLHKRSAQALGSIDLRRVRAVWSAVGGLLRGQRLWLTALGRELDSEALEKHSIKRMDRLLGNRSMSTERTHWYRWISDMVLTGVPEPVVIVDWSPLNARGDLHVLRAAVAVGGRSLPIYERVHTRSNDPKAQSSLLKQLRRVIGSKKRPIIVTDAGFGVDWFEQVEQMGWRYVGRILGILSVDIGNSGRWIRNTRLHAQATAKPTALGTSRIRQGRPMTTRLYLYERPYKGRVHLTPTGKRSRSAPSQKQQIREAQPWLLASNIEPTGEVARRVVSIYHRRMQIEESFRDLKSPRHGFAFRHNMGRNRQRVANLLVLGALGVLATWLMGLHGKAKGMVRGLQANTVSDRPVLSTFFIGRRLLSKRIRIGPRQIIDAFEQLRSDANEQAFVFVT